MRDRRGRGGIHGWYSARSGGWPTRYDRPALRPAASGVWERGALLLSLDLSEDTSGLCLEAVPVPCLGYLGGMISGLSQDLSHGKCRGIKKEEAATTHGTTST